MINRNCKYHTCIHMLAFMSMYKYCIHVTICEPMSHGPICHEHRTIMHIMVHLKKKNKIWLTCLTDF